MTQPGTQTEFDAALQAALAAQDPRFPDGTHGDPFVILSAGQRVESLESLLPTPSRIRQQVKFEATESFGRYVAGFKLPETLLFADAESHVVTAVLDYHLGAAGPNWGSHRASLKLRHTREWLTWTGKSGKSFTQADFAEFLQDNLPDIAEPPGAEVLEAAKHLEAKKTVQFRSGINLDNGTIQFGYDEAHENKGKGAIVMPNLFILGIAPFENGPAYKVRVRLRYRINDTALTFLFVVDRPEKIVEDAFRQVLADVETATGLKPLLGSV